MNQQAKLSLLGILLPASLQAATIIDADFEGENDLGAFTFSQNSNVPIVSDPNGVGNNGTEGHVFTVGAQTGPADFAGGGFFGIDFGAEPSFTAGSFTVEQLDTISLSYDAATAGSGVNSVRFEPAGGGFADGLFFPVTPSGAFATYTVDFSNFDTAAKENFVSLLNTNNSLVSSFSFSFNANGAGTYDVGDSASFDNFLLETTIPEPSSALLCGFAAIGLLRRRR